MTKEHPCDGPGKAGGGAPHTVGVPATLSRFERSGQSGRGFYEAEGLLPGTFFWWRRELGRTEAHGAPADAALFVELRDGRPAAPA